MGRLAMTILSQHMLVSVKCTESDSTKLKTSKKSFPTGEIIWNHEIKIKIKSEAFIAQQYCYVIHVIV